MPTRTRHVYSLGNTASLSDLGGHFGRWQQPTHAGFSTLTQLNFDRSNGSRCNRFEERVQAKVALIIAASEISGPELKNQFSTMKVMFSYAAFTSVVKTAVDSGATIERLNSRS